MDNRQLAFASIEEVARLFRRRKLSPVELTKFLLQRIDNIHPQLNAFLSVTPEIALGQAKKAEGELFSSGRGKGRRDRGLLHGIPISLKDNIYTQGVRTTAGSRILRDFVPAGDAQVVTQLKKMGVVFLGKTNMHEFAYGVTSNNPHYGAVRNPWDVARIPGGSSGGSAAAVAAGLGYASIGTDTGGSIRIPASLCGVVGYKPTWGAVSVEGTLPLSPTLDCVGPLARTVRDATILFDAIRSRSNRRAHVPSPLKTSPKTAKLKLGIPREFFLDVISAEVRKLFDAVIQGCRKRGAAIKEISIPLLEETEDAGNQIAWAEATHYHQSCGYFPARAGEYGEDVRMRLEMGTTVSATMYLKALKTRATFIGNLHGAMAAADVDALMVPTTPIAAPLIGEEKTRIAEKDYPTRALLLRLNRPANLAGVPAISIPCGFTPAGLPVGLQLIGAKNCDQALLDMARAVEDIWHEDRRPTL